MIDIAVMGFIRADGDDDLAQPRIGRKLPVINGGSGRRHVGVRAVVHASQILGVAADRLESSPRISAS